MENLFKDIRYGFRSIVKRPGFSLVAIVTLALGIGANSAIFSVVNGVLWRPLPFPKPEQLVMAWTDHQGRGGPAQEWFRPAEVEDWRQQNKVFSHFSAYNNWAPTLTGDHEPESLVGAAVSYDMFGLLGVAPARGMDVVVRTQGEPLSLAPALRQQVWAGDRNLAIVNLGTMKDLVSSSITQQRFILTLLACFAGLALMLAAVGIYGVMSYAVTQRTQEIGIRMALGARVVDVLRLVFRQGLALTLIGVAVGMALAAGLTRLMKSLLFEVTPTDAATFALVAMALVVVALLACLVPARRATKVDPLIALRYE